MNLSARLDYERPHVKVELNSHYSNGRELSITLNLEKDTQQHYQLIGFNASLPDASGSHKSISHDFSTESGITVPEAATLLEGRSVLKSAWGLLGSEQGRWLQLDKGLLNDGKHLLTAFSAEDFALGEQLASLSIRLKRPELANDKILRAMESAAQISIKAVTGEEVYLEANSAARSIVFRDSTGKECTEKQVREKDKRRQQQLQVEPVAKVERNNTKKQQQAQGLSIG